MKIITVSYKKKFPAGVYLNEDIGFEASVDDTEDPLKTINLLRELAELSHKEKYPQYYQPNDGYNVHGIPNNAVEQPQSVPIENIDKIDAFIEVINSKYMTKNALEKMKPQVEKENNERLTKAFEEKLKSFN